jgi:hypothetical protein
MCCTLFLLVGAEEMAPSGPLSDPSSFPVISLGWKVSTGLLDNWNDESSKTTNEVCVDYSLSQNHGISSRACLSGCCFP